MTHNFSIGREPLTAYSEAMPLTIFDPRGLIDGDIIQFIIYYN
jgi:hypothetical protein